MKLTFLGAAGEVTGSQHLLETNKLRLLFDCGLFQGHRSESRRKNEQFRCEPAKLDGVVLSHAHIDHCGNLPGLYKAGFRGPVFCTEATAHVAEVMLRDSARIQQEDVRYLKRHHKKSDRPLVEPLYDEEHVEGIVKQFEPLEYHQWHELATDVRLQFHDAGHILGSAISQLQIYDAGEWSTLVFTGDLGRRNLPLLRDPQLLDECDVLITECTYGNRVHPPATDIRADLQRIISEAAKVDGKVIIPAFSLGRTQNVVYYLNELTNAGALPRVPIFVDSPLSRRLTSIYRDHKDIMDDNIQNLLTTDYDPFGFQGLTYVGSRQESIELNRRPGPFVVISASGMCESGRVLHHLKNSVSQVENTIVIIGFQARHTLGRRIVEKQEYLRIFNREYPLKAKVETLNGLSAHADAADFKWWFEHLASKGGIGRAFLVHGEAEAAEAQAQMLHDLCNEDPVIPQLYESFEL